MKTFRSAAIASILGIALAGVAVAQHDDHHDDHHGNFHDDHHNDHYVQHNDWHKGYHMSHDDWNRGDRIDYRQYHLNAPPRGYEWRRVDGNYVMAAVATGVIASAIVASSVH